MQNKYAVFGNPIHHSLSPEIHALFAKQQGLDIEYQRILVSNGKFYETIQLFTHEGGVGANITLPLKEIAYEFVDQLSDRAYTAKSVNTMILLEKRENKSLWLGDNTDGIGLVHAIKSFNISIKNRSILILGAGGAVKGILQPLIDEDPKSILIANRTVFKAQQLAQEFFVDYSSIDDIPHHQFDLIINGVSASLKGEEINLPEHIFQYTSLAYDMVYAQELTPFLQLAQNCKVPQIEDGLSMLVYQAAESYKLWRKFTPDAKTVLAKMYRNKKIII